MVHCKICKGDIGYLGWANHVSMHKRAFERANGMPPKDWQEVLAWYDALPEGRPAIKRAGGCRKLSDYVP